MPDTTSTDPDHSPRPFTLLRTEVQQRLAAHDREARDYAASPRPPARTGDPGHQD